ncbi:hypothetical protein [Pseudomonas sp. EMN2]|uniref:hypothetical protein n=1 Tax=Pseudomonas sp. EMN2 TaxID=2615212 RepID=UPI00129AC49B|nr:hypothetical protein [Pseudomonas sp. EMN2]
MTWSSILEKSKNLLGIGGDHRGLSFEIRLNALLFIGKRPDYYRFLADLLKGTKGKRSLMEIFMSDADRYGSSVRGKLSSHWAKMFDQGGGSLKHTFSGTLPRQDVEAMDALLKAGGENALELALHDLADSSHVQRKALDIIVASCISAFLSLIILVAYVLMYPLYVVPQIISAFSMLPLDQYPESATKMMEYTDFIGSFWPAILLSMVAAILACAWTLPNLSGHVRIHLDKYWILWSIHRDFESIRFLSFLATMLSGAGSSHIVLRDALEMQLQGASRWKRHHVQRMIAQVKSGQIGPWIFSTGFLERSMDYYLADLIEANGLEKALKQVKDRLSQSVLKRITVQSMIISWVITLSVLLVSTGLMIWQARVVDEMRRALQLFVS